MIRMLFFGDLAPKHKSALAPLLGQDLQLEVSHSIEEIKRKAKSGDFDLLLVELDPPGKEKMQAATEHLRGERDFIRIFNRRLIEEMKTATGTGKLEEALEDLRRLKNLNEQIVDNIPDPILLIDNRGTIRQVNQGLLSVTHTGREDWIGGDCFEMIPELTRYRDSILPSSDRNKGPFEANNIEMNITKERGSRTFDVKASYLVGADGRISGAVVRLEDVTERNRIQIEIAQSLKLASLGQLSAGIAHELRNPLGIVGTSLYYLKEVIASEDPGVEEHLEIMSSELNRMRRVIDNLLEFARQSRFNLQSINVNEVLEMTLSLLEKDFRTRDIELRVNLAQISEVEINLDELKQAFLNILLNAVQAMPNGGILEVETHLEDSTPREGEVKVIFRDTGCGISEEDLSRIFDPFFTTKAPGEGTGLGLSITRSILKRFSGTIDVQSKLGQGTTVTLSIPSSQKGHQASGDSE